MSRLDRVHLVRELAAHLCPRASKKPCPCGAVDRCKGVWWTSFRSRASDAISLLEKMPPDLRARVAAHLSDNYQEPKE